MCTVLSSFALALSLSLSTSAFAHVKADCPQAEQSLNEGIKAYKEGRYEEALANYQRAAELAPSASGPYREMGKVYEALGRPEAARTSYQEYLRRKPNAEDANEINERLTALGATN